MTTDCTLSAADHRAKLQTVNNCTLHRGQLVDSTVENSHRRSTELCIAKIPLRRLPRNFPAGEVLGNLGLSVSRWDDHVTGDVIGDRDRRVVVRSSRREVRVEHNNMANMISLSRLQYVDTPIPEELAAPPGVGGDPARCRQYGTVRPRELSLLPGVNVLYVCGGGGCHGVVHHTGGGSGGGVM